MSLMALSVILFVVLYQRRVIRHQAELQAVESQRQMDLMQASLQSEEEERRRIAAELHDDIGATLASARLFLYQAEKSSDPKIIQQSRELVDESIRKVRAVSHKLQPATLQALGLASSLHALAELYNATGTIRIDINEPALLPRLPEHTELHVYRVVQELINNLVKHAHTQKVLITLRSMSDGIVLAVDHNGTGITQGEFETLLNSRSGIGLKNISNRVGFIRGSILFSKTSDGYSIQLKVPIEVKGL